MEVSPRVGLGDQPRGQTNQPCASGQLPASQALNLHGLSSQVSPRDVWSVYRQRVSFAVSPRKSPLDMVRVSGEVPGASGGGMGQLPLCRPINLHGCKLGSRRGPAPSPWPWPQPPLLQTHRGPRGKTRMLDMFAIEGSTGLGSAPCRWHAGYQFVWVSLRPAGMGSDGAARPDWGSSRVVVVSRRGHLVARSFAAGVGGGH